MREYGVTRDLPDHISNRLSSGDLSNVSLIYPIHVFFGFAFITPVETPSSEAEEVVVSIT